MNSKKKNTSKKRKVLNLQVEVETYLECKRVSMMELFCEYS